MEDGASHSVFPLDRDSLRIDYAVALLLRVTQLGPNTVCSAVRLNACITELEQ